MELSWNPNPHFGAFVGGIGPFFRRHVRSCGAYFFASGFSLSLQVHGQFHERLGEVEIPSTIYNLVTIRDTINQLIDRLEKEVDLLVLEIMRTHENVSFSHCMALVRQLYKRWDIVDEDEVSSAVERLKNKGFVESEVEYVPQDRPHFRFLYKITSSGISELDQRRHQLDAVILTDQEQQALEARRPPS